MRNKSALMATSALVLGSAPAMADTPMWQGAYVGAGMSALLSGDVDFDGSTYDYGSGENAASIFAGYNHAFDSNVLVGGELSYAPGEFGDIDGLSGSTSDKLLDAKFKLGYGAGNWVAYVILSASQTDFSAAETQTQTGFGYGVGAQYHFDNGIFAGAELVSRTTDSSDNVLKKSRNFPIETELRLLNLRVGYMF